MNNHELDAMTLGSWGLGADYFEFDPNTSEEVAAEQSRQLLCKALNTSRLVAFIGAGVSKNSGLPLTAELARQLFETNIGRPRAGALTGNSTAHPGVMALGRAYDAGLLNVGPRDATEGNRGLVVDPLDLMSESFEALRAADRQGARLKVARMFRELDEAGAQKRGVELLHSMMRPPLQIRRFVTTNYDYQIERAFDRECGTRLAPEPGLSERVSYESGHRYTFTPRSLNLGGDPRALLLFALAAPGYEAGVFHCHGDYLHPETMIVTERDYQQQYLPEGTFQNSYRQALTLLFMTNPVLFVGASLNEPDLLRPLRTFAATRPRGVREPPWFVLMMSPEDANSAYLQRKRLYRQFGIKTLFYPYTADPGAGLDAKLREIERDSVRWWHAQRHLPFLRSSSVRKGGSNSVRNSGGGEILQHHGSVEPPYFPATEGVAAAVRYLKAEPGGVITFYGADGCGKTSIALALIQEDYGLGYAKLFYASARYRNEFASVLQSAARFFAGEGSPGSDDKPLDRLAYALASNKFIMVLDGFERLLEPVERSGDGLQQGESIAAEIHRFLTMVQVLARVPSGGSGSPFKSHVVLVSSMVPRGFDRRYDVARVSLTQVRAAPDFCALDGDLVTELYEMVDHAYVLSLVAVTLKALSPDERTPWIESLLARLAGVSNSGRATRAIEAVLELRRRLEGSREPGHVPLWWELLLRVVLFTTPVTAAVLHYALGGTSSGFSEQEIRSSLRRLKDWRLLLPIKYSDDVPGPRYAAHTLVRTVFNRRLGSSRYTTGEPHQFVLPGFASAAEPPVAMTQDAFVLAGRVADELLAGLHSELRQLAEAPEERQRPNEAINLVRTLGRAVFGLMRGRWMAVGLSQLCEIRTPDGETHYGVYRQRLLRLHAALMTFTATMPRLGLEPGGRPSTSETGARSYAGWMVTSTPEDCASANAILYPDELIWLLNEISLTAQLVGNTYDANATLYLVRNVTEVDRWTLDTDGQRKCQMLLNSVALAIDLGNFLRAKSELDQTERLVQGLPPLRIRDHLEAIAKGYRAMVNHHDGNHERASHLYDEVVKQLRTLGHHRALSLFLRYQSELLRETGKVEAACRVLRASILAAEQGNHRGLALLARLRLSLLETGDGHRESAASQLHGSMDASQAALAFAKSMGAERIVQAVYAADADLASSRQELLRAKESGYHALELAASLGMRREVTRLLAVLGSVARREQDMVGARLLLTASVTWARTERYHDGGSDVAARELMALESSIPPPSENSEGYRDGNAGVARDN